MVNHLVARVEESALASSGSLVVLVWMWPSAG